MCASKLCTQREILSEHTFLSDAKEGAGLRKEGKRVHIALHPHIPRSFPDLMHQTESLSLNELMKSTPVVYSGTVQERRIPTTECDGSARSAETKVNAPVAGCAALGGFLFGYDTAVVNGAVFQMKDHFAFDMNSWQAGLIVSIAVVGAFLGSMFAGELAGRFGRWRAMVAADLLFVVGSVMLAFASTLQVVYAGRFVLGLGIGIASVTIPVYLAEMAPARTRGKVITINNFNITGGQFVASGVCAAFVVWTSKNVGWRWMFGLGALPAALQLLGLMVFLPETPRFLLLRGRLAEAKDVAARFGVEMDAEEAGGDEHGIVGSGLLAMFKNSSLHPRLLVGVGLQFFQQASGINTIMYYSSAILKDAGFKGDTAPVLFSIPLAAINALCTLGGLFVVDNWGRRPTLLRSLGGCLACTLLMALLGFLHTAHHVSEEATAWLFLVTLGLYLVSFAPGMGPIPWIMNAELFPTNMRAAAAAVCTMANWASNAAVSQAFPSLMSGIGVGGTFLVISGFVIGAMLFVHKKVPETKQLSLEEIESLFTTAVRRE